MLLLGKGLRPLRRPLPRSHKPRLRVPNNTFPPGLVIENAISPGSGLVIDFATSPVRTGNSFFVRQLCVSIAISYCRQDCTGSQLIGPYKRDQPTPAAITEEVIMLLVTYLLDPSPVPTNPAYVRTITHFRLDW